MKANAFFKNAQISLPFTAKQLLSTEN